MCAFCNAWFRPTGIDPLHAPPSAVSQTPFYQRDLSPQHPSNDATHPTMLPVHADTYTSKFVLVKAQLVNSHEITSINKRNCFVGPFGIVFSLKCTLTYDNLHGCNGYFGTQVYLRGIYLSFKLCLQLKLQFSYPESKYKNMRPSETHTMQCTICVLQRNFETNAGFFF